MTTAAKKVSPPQGVLAPRLLLWGVVVSFLACCAAGRLLSRVNCLCNFSRFHPYLNYQSLYYPTVSQVRSLARDTLDPDKVVVVLGGNSILLGYGQGAEGNWTRHLQALLGNRFQVLNLALPGTPPFEFGATAAEVLLRDHPRLLFVTNTWSGPLSPPGDPDGQPLLRYFFWQARVRGLLAENAEREKRLRELEGKRDESFRELKRQSELDADLGFNDLWNAFTYRCRSTVWFRYLQSPWTQPRRCYADPDPVLPSADERMLQAKAAETLPEMRGVGNLTRAFRRPPAGTAAWREPDSSAMLAGVRACLPPGLRSRTLVLLNPVCPYYRTQLTAEERELYAESFAVTIRQYARAGVRAAEVGRMLSARHYTDHVHLTVAGGRLMAEEVAPMIRAFAQQLGYVKAGSAVAAAALRKGGKP